jgi:hypothetical protein
MARYATNNTAASQTNESVVAAVAGQRIRVYAMFLVGADTASDVTLNTKPAGANTAVTPLMAFGTNGGIVLPYNPKGWFQTAAGDALTVTTGAGGATGIQVIYDYIPVA